MLIQLKAMMMGERHRISAVVGHPLTVKSDAAEAPRTPKMLLGIMKVKKLLSVRSQIRVAIFIVLTGGLG